MTKKENCWEFMNCGRTMKGSKQSELGVCPAVTDTTSNGLNGGINGGRICWAISGTLCGGKIQGSFTNKHISCMACDFYKKVKLEEDPTLFRMLKHGQEYKKRNQE